MAILTGLTISGGGITIVGASTVAANDPYFMYNTLLLPGNGTNGAQNNTFTDGSTNSFAITRNGNTTQGTFSPYGGNWSNFYGTTTMGWQTPAASATTIIGTATLTSASTFTVEAWVYQLTRHSGGGAVLGYVFGSMNISGGQADWTIGPNSDGKLTVFWYNSGNNICNSTNTVPLNTWTHIAVSINAGAISMYINGVKETLTGTTTATTTSGSPLGYLASGGYAYGGSTWQGFNGYISNLRVVKSALYSVTFTPSTTPLTAISGTSLLTCQSNRFIDTSINSFTLTITNALTIQRFSPFNPSIVTPTSYSGYFDGTGDYLTAPSTAVFAFGTGAYTIEAWVYVTSRSTEGSIWAPGSQNNNLLITTGGLLRLYNGTSYTGTTVIALNTWAHVAVVRTSTATNGTQLFVNGVSDLVFTDTTNQTSATTGIIGVNNTGSNQYFPGYISNLRIVKAVAVYTGAFTVPTSPLAATQSSGTNIVAITGTSTSLLTLQSPTFIDNSTTPSAITASGNSQPTQQNPFGFTTATTNGYTSNTIGGSGYFDGVGDYLVTAADSALALATNAADFTIECWVYNKGYAGSQYGRGICIYYPSAGYGSNRLMFRLASGADHINVYLLANSSAEFGGSGAEGAATITPNAWTHVALVRNAGVFYVYVNGVLDITVNSSSAASSIPFTTFNMFDIGRTQDGSSPDWFGNISNYRFVKGTAVYTSNFVPPSQPVTAVTNTALLLNMTNAGIIDNAMMNNLDTVGNAQISTTQSQFGGSSMYFDGTGDWLVTPISTSLGMGTGDFTIEGWVYATSPTYAQGFFHVNATAISGTVAGYAIGVTAAGAVEYYSGATYTTSSSTVTANTWTHLALVRSAGTVKVYVNGILPTSGSSIADSQNVTSALAYIGVFYTVAASTTMTGYINDFRVTKGYARYTANFTPPTTAFPIN
jgi:hypothetical protein